MGQRFTRDELKDISEAPSEKAIRALDTGDMSSFHEHLFEMSTGQNGVESLTLHVLARFIGELRNDLGESEAKGVLDSVASQIMESFVRDWRQGEEKKVIEDLVAIFKHQGGATVVPVSESAHEIVFDLTPCGSGGRYLADGTVQKSPQWYGEWADGVSSVCQACKSCQSALNRATGEEIWSTEISADVPGRCTLKFKKSASSGESMFPGNAMYEVARTRTQEIQIRLSKNNFGIRDLLRNHHRDWIPWHDFSISLMAFLFGETENRHGSAYLAKVLDSAYNSVFRLFYPVFKRLTEEENLRYLSRTHHYHMMQFELTEEDDRYKFKLNPCGSGGRLLRGEMWRDLFRYGRQPASVMVKGPQPLTFGRDELPVYCTHCAAHNKDQFAADVLYFVNDGNAQTFPGTSCIQYTYKKDVGVSSVDGRLRAQVELQ